MQKMEIISYSNFNRKINHSKISNISTCNLYNYLPHSAGCDRIIRHMRRAYNSVYSFIFQVAVGNEFCRPVAKLICFGQSMGLSITFKWLQIQSLITRVSRMKFPGCTSRNFQLIIKGGHTNFIKRIFYLTK